MGPLTGSVEVDRRPGGVLVAVRRRGRDYRGAQEPVRWYERRVWWAEDALLPGDRGIGAVDQQMWRAQVRLTAHSEPLTLELVHTLDTGRRRLLAATSASGVQVVRCAQPPRKVHRIGARPPATGGSTRETRHRGP